MGVAHANSYSPYWDVNRKYEIAHVTADVSGVAGVSYYLAKYDEETDNCGQTVHIPDKKTNDHPYKDGITKSDIKDALKNPYNDKVWKAISNGDTMYYYINQASNGVWFIVRVVEKNPFFSLTVSTSLSETKGKFNDGDSAEERLQKMPYDADEYDC